MKNLILGQGLAGTVLAFQLLKRGEEITILDNGHYRASSLVAAGMWNPIVFKRMNKSWWADEFLTALHEFYPEVERLVGTKFFHSKPIFRIHGSKQEADLWMEKQSLPGFMPFLKTDEPEALEGFHSPENGSGEVVGAGYVHMRTFLESSAVLFKKEGILKNELFQMPEIPAEISDLNYDRIIDCRGVVSANDSCWNMLPLKPTKGEVLTIHAPQFQLSSVFNAGFFVLPLGDDMYRVGATFDWKNLDYEPTQQGAQMLVDKLRKWTDLPFEIVDHKAGVRPTVKDRRPLLGRHPDILKLFVFNGLGAKGVMMAPLLSELLTHFILDQKDLPKEVDIQRFLT